MTVNKKEFLQTLGDLYEEGKQHLYQLQYGKQLMSSKEENDHFDKLYLILKNHLNNKLSFSSSKTNTK